MSNTLKYDELSSTITTLEGPAFVILCEDGVCSKKNVEVGYYKNSIDMKCSGSPIQCIKYTKSEKGCDEENIISQIDKDDHLCLNSTGTIYSEFDADGTSDYALIYYDEDSIFTNVSSEKYGLIKASTHTLLIDTTTSSICVNESTFDVTPKEGTCSSPTVEYSCISGVCGLKTSEGQAYEKECDVVSGVSCTDGSYHLKNTELFYCEKQGDPCQSVSDVGYFIVDETTIFFCKKNGITLECGSLANVANEENCSNALVGEVAMINSQLSICVSNDTPIPLTSSNKGTYIVYGKSGDIFGINGAGKEYGIINVDEKIITLHQNYNNHLKYVYVDQSETGKYKVLEKGISTCPTDKDNGMLELECSNGFCKTPAA